MKQKLEGHRERILVLWPGNIIQGIRKAMNRNCVMMLDEIDKISSSFHVIPLLHVGSIGILKNFSFRDRLSSGSL